MPFVDPTQPGQDEEDKNPSQVDQALNPSSSQQAQSQSDQAPPSTSAGGAGVNSPGGSGAGSSAQAGASAPKPSTSGSWTNLNSYLGANSDQATQLGTQIAGSVNQKGQQAQTDISNLGTNFGQAVNQNVVAQNEDATNKAITDASGLTAGQTLNADDQQAFNTQANASYGGPTDVTTFNGYNQAQQDVNTAAQAANATKTEAGRGTLLQDQFKDTSKYGYSQGESNLDQLLLQNSKGAQDALAPVANNWSNLDGALNTTVTSGANQAQQAAQTDQTTSAAAKNALSSATSNFQNNLTGGLTDLQTQNQNLWSSLQAAVNSGQITPEEAQSLGFQTSDNNPDSSHNYLAPAALGKYFSQAANPTLSSFANADQYAQAAALAQLAGQSDSSFLPSANISQAGTATAAPAFTANGTQFQADNTTASAEYNNQQANDLKQIQSMGGGSSGIAVPLGQVAQFNTVQGSVDWAQAILSGQPAPNGAFGSAGTHNSDGSITYPDAFVNTARQIMQTLNNTQQQYGFGNYFNPTMGNVIR